MQKHVSAVLMAMARLSTTLRMLDTHDQVTFLNRKPDICIVPANHAKTVPAAWYVVALGDVKGRRSRQEKFNSEEIGSLVSFLQDLLRTLADRGVATGFLTDSYIIQFFRVRLTPAAPLGMHVDATRPYHLKRPRGKPALCGGDLLLSLLLQKPTALGCPMIDLSVDRSVVEISRYLGEGSWCGKGSTKGAMWWLKSFGTTNGPTSSWRWTTWNGSRTSRA